MKTQTALPIALLSILAPLISSHPLPPFSSSQPSTLSQRSITCPQDCTICPNGKFHGTTNRDGTFGYTCSTSCTPPQGTLQQLLHRPARLLPHQRQHPARPCPARNQQPVVPHLLHPVRRRPVPVDAGRGRIADVHMHRRGTGGGGGAGVPGGVHPADAGVVSGAAGEEGVVHGAVDAVSEAGEGERGEESGGGEWFMYDAEAYDADGVSCDASFPFGPLSCFWSFVQKGQVDALGLD